VEEIFTTTYYGNTIEEWAVSLGIIVISAVVARFVYWVFKKVIKPFTDRTKTDLDDIILDMIEEPAAFAVLLAGSWFALSLLNTSPEAATWISRAFHILFAINVAWLLSRTYDALHERYLVSFARRTDTELDDTLLPVLQNGIRLSIWFLGFVVGLNNAGYDIMAILASLGIGGLAFALAAQDTVANIFGGITVLTGRPFRVGDRVEIAGINGWIIQIGLRNSMIQDWYGHVHMVPNKIFTDTPVMNIDAREVYRVELRFHLAHQMTPEQVQTAMRICTELVADAGDLIADEHWVTLDDVGHQGFEIQMWYGIEKLNEADGFGYWFEKYSAGKNFMHLGLLQRFSEAGIELALPLEVRTGPDRSGEGPFRLPPSG